MPLRWLFRRICALAGTNALFALEFASILFSLLLVSFLGCQKKSGLLAYHRPAGSIHALWQSVTRRVHQFLTAFCLSHPHTDASEQLFPAQHGQTSHRNRCEVGHFVDLFVAKNQKRIQNLLGLMPGGIITSVRNANLDDNNNNQ